MIRTLGFVLATSTLIIAVVAAQQPPDRPQDERANKQDKREQEKLKDPVPPATSDDTHKIVERLNKNMDASEERLGNKDSGEETRKIQAEIIKDIDELMKQKSKGGGGGGGGAGASSSSEGGDQRPSGGAPKSGVKRSSRSGSGKQSRSKNEVAKDASQKNNPDKLGKDDLGQKNTVEQSAKSGTAKDGGEGTMASKSQAKKDNTLGDLFKDVWGHLPLSKRQEMDAYARERFLAKYDEILRQYYRTISEQGRRKVGD